MGRRVGCAHPAGSLDLHPEEIAEGPVKTFFVIPGNHVARIRHLAHLQAGQQALDLLDISGPELAQIRDFLVSLK